MPSQGAQSFSDEISIESEGVSSFIIGAGWLIEIVELESGEYFFFRDGEEVRAETSRFGIFYPAFSIVRMCAKYMKGHVTGIGSFGQMPAGLPDFPMIFETKFFSPISDVEQAFEILKSSNGRQSIEINTKPSLISLRAKRLIDENYQVYPSIARIAGRLRVSHEHLSRQFKRDYGLTPSAYLHQVRVAEATYKLSKGEEIIDISHEVGYNDLSRFYKQFRKSTKTSPGICRTTMRSTAAKK